MTGPHPSEDGDRQVRPFADFLREQAGGTTHAELSASLIDLVEAVQATGKKGSLRLDITVATVGNNRDAIQVTARVATKAPLSDPQASIFFTDHDGNLVRENPNQPHLPLTEVPTPRRVDTVTGEILEAQ